MRTCLKTYLFQHCYLLFRLFNPVCYHSKYPLHTSNLLKSIELYLLQINHFRPHTFLILINTELNLTGNWWLNLSLIQICWISIFDRQLKYQQTQFSCHKNQDIHLCWSLKFLITFMRTLSRYKQYPIHFYSSYWVK